MKKNRNNFYAIRLGMASLAIALMAGGCSRQMAMNGQPNQVRYVQTQDMPTNHAATIAAGNDIPVMALAPESQPSPTAQLRAKQVQAANIVKHGLAQKQAANTIQGETANNAIAINNATIHRHHSTVRNAEINRGGLISGIILLILGSILYVLPGPIGYILGTIVVVIAVILIITAVL